MEVDSKLSSKLIDYFKEDVKLSYVTEKNVLIVTKQEEIVYEFERDFETSSILTFTNDEKFIESKIIDEFRSEKIVAFKNNLNHSIALTVEGRVFCWGNNAYGQLGNGTLDPNSYKPQLIQNLIDVIDVSCGSKHCVALTRQGQVYAWGDNSCGQIGNAKVIEELKDQNELFPVEVVSLGSEKIRSISCGSEHSLALTETGKVFSWGNNREGQLGIGSRESSNKPQSIEINSKINKISCGPEHSLLLTCDGFLYAFGRNDYRQIRTENTGDVLSPLKLSLENVSDIATHYFHNFSAALVNDLVFIWGNYNVASKVQIDQTNFKCFDELFENYLQINYEPKSFIFKFKDNLFLNGKYKKSFEEKKELGSGSFGTVFKVIDNYSKSTFAIKKIRFQSNKEEEELLRELKIFFFMKKNHDSRIVGCFDAWLENETTSGVHSGLFFKDILLCIQMEYCEKTLQNIMEEMKTDKIFNGSQCLTEVGYYIASDIFIQIVEGVKFLHEKNIIHRDLKPNNILLNSNFNERYVKIADFGLVAFHEFAQESHTSKVGNELYAAPEVRFGRNYNMKSDIFSLGVILNELFKIDKYSRIKVKSDFSEISSKYDHMKILCQGMTCFFEDDRPDCVNIISAKNDWAVYENDLVISKNVLVILNSQSKLGEKFVHKFLRYKFGHKKEEVISKKENHLSEIFDNDNIDITVKKGKSMIKGSITYDMGSKPRGYCIIINNKAEDLFRECERLEMVFKQLYFEVDLKKNLNVSAIRGELKSLDEKPLRLIDALVVIIISDEISEERILGIEGCKGNNKHDSIGIQEIIDIFSLKTFSCLNYKPKMIFFICSRNADFNPPGKPIPSNNIHKSFKTKPIEKIEIKELKTLDENRAKEIVDFFIIFASFEGIESFSNKSTGMSYFTQAFTHSIAEEAGEKSLQIIVSQTYEHLLKYFNETVARPPPDIRVKSSRRPIFFNPGFP